MAHQHKPIIGIVGGVGSGKSAVARWVAEHHNGRILDADAVGHQVLFHQDVKARLRQVFGNDIFAGGEVDRKRLAAVVFGDKADQANSRRQLEAIVHPAMAEVFQQELAAAAADDAIRFVLFDAAVLLETGWRDRCDVVAFVDVPREQRIQRVTTSRGWTEDELARREASQWPLDRKRSQAHVVIDNSKTVEQAGEQLAEFLCEQGWLTDQRSSCSMATP